MGFRMIQVGLGDFGRRWLDVVRNDPSWTVAAIATRNGEVRTTSGDLAGVPHSRRFCSLAEAVSAGVEADALLVTTPHFRHEEDVRVGLLHGLNVLVEKPLAGSWAECLRIVTETERAGHTVMVAENYRYGEGAQLVHEIVASGEIGVPELLRLDYFVGHTFPDDDWRNEYAYPLLIENATHHFDLVRFVTGADAESVSCSVAPSRRTPHWRAPSVEASFEMTGGLHFAFVGSWAYGEFPTPWEGEWRLFGSRGALRWTRDTIEVRRGCESRRLHVPSLPSDSTLAATFGEFTSALSERRAPQTALADNLRTVAMVFAAIRSAEEDTPVSVRGMLSETGHAG